ncbi:MAG: YdcF family protein [Candidatus Hydrogenedentes bacterium]|nr:YdcF family protein [Candidatus Hydrogenedentota bacterium]
MPRDRLTKILLVAIIAIVSAFVVAGVAIAIDGLRDEAGAADVAVVLGSKVDDSGLPSPRLQARLDAALAAYEAGLVPEIIASGASGAEGYNEAEVMGAYLVSKGVPTEHVHLDPEGFNTYETARNTARWMKVRGVKRVLAVSQYFHLPRTRLALTRFGIDEVYTAHPSFFEFRDFYAIGREVAAWASYLLRDYPHG